LLEIHIYNDLQIKMTFEIFCHERSNILFVYIESEREREREKEKNIQLIAN